MSSTKEELQDASTKLNEKKPAPMNTMLEKQPRTEALQKREQRSKMVVKDVPPTTPGNWQHKYLHTYDFPDFTIVWFQIISIHAPHPKMVYGSHHPIPWNFHLGFETPLPLRISSDHPWGVYEYFLEPHNVFYYKFWFHVFLCIVSFTGLGNNCTESRQEREKDTKMPRVQATLERP